MSSAQSTDQNFILSRNYTVPNASIQSGSSFWGTPQQVRSQLIYLDALGKQRQQISVYGSSSATTDLIQQTDYDSLHRPVLQYLPVPSGSGNKGSFSSVSGNSYYKSVSNNVILGSDQFYSKTSYEKSPLSRVTQVQAPGVTGNGVRSVFKVSDGTIKRYQAGTDLTSISQTGTYAAGELTYTEAKDENDKTVQEYTDYQGRTVLKRIIQASDDYLDTYYVYGATGQLRAVLQPQFQVPGKNDVNHYAFLYLYDARGNLTDKKVPGSKAVKMIYDSRDRLETLTDGNGKVFKYSYDTQLNRLTQTQLGSQTISVNYYDSYPTEIPSLAFKVSDIFPEWTSSPTTYFLKSSPTAQVNGLLTASDQYLFNAEGNPTSDFLRTVTYYNQKGQVIQVVRQLYGLSGGATERISYLLDFSGKVIRERTDQSSSSWSFHLEKGFAYDHMDRVVKVMHRVWKGDYATAAVKQYTHSEITYDAVGQPKMKKLHGTMQELSYKNHLRGWLGTVRSTLFDLTLNYFPNGNIENLGWRAGGRNGTMQMNYDGANRLLTATGAGSFEGNSERLTYDKNGNINTLKRDEGKAPIDQLTYTYQGNQLQGVSEAANKSVGFVEGSTVAIQYLYDDNGNLKEDKHRNQTLQYNALNLISSMKRAGGQVLSYIYDASGTKHQLVAPGQTTTYAGAFEYQGEGNLKRIAVEEGQIVRQGDNFTVQYYLKDHLGNVRVVLNETGQAQQVTEYHAFGKAISQTGSNWQTNRYLYNGKELQPETEYLDYGARQYDPVLGKWMSIDPLSEKMRRWSPYTYAFDNPLRFIDPDGMAPSDPPKWLQGSLKKFEQFTGWELNLTGSITYGTTALEGKFFGLGVEANVSPDEMDLVGFRNNTFKLMGYDTSSDKIGIQTSQSTVGFNIGVLGFENQSEKEGDRVLKNTTTTSLHYISREANNKGEAGTKVEIFAAKAGLVLGFDIAVELTKSDPTPKSIALDRSKPSILESTSIKNGIPASKLPTDTPRTKLSEERATSIVNYLKTFK